MAIVAIITLVLMPLIGQGLALSGGAMLGSGIVLGTVALMGGLLGIFGGGAARGANGTDVTRAIEELLSEYPGGDERRYREAAIRILDGAYLSRGPAMVLAFDRQEVADRLAETLPYVERIERILLERNDIRAVFTRRRREEGLDEEAPPTP